MSNKVITVLFLAIVFSCSAPSGKKHPDDLAVKIQTDEYFAFTKQKALEVIKTGFNAGDGYREVWIRDYNTFIELAAEVYPKEELKENLLVFFRMQGEDGNIIDGFTPAEQITEKYDFIYSDLEPRYAGHKNTVETDQEPPGGACWRPAWSRRLPAGSRRSIPRSPRRPATDACTSQPPLVRAKRDSVASTAGIGTTRM